MTNFALTLLLLACQDDPIQKLVDQLGADDLEARVRAEEDLLKLGEKVQPYLEKALGSSDSEIRSRARELLKEVARRALRDLGFFAGRGAARGQLLLAGGGGKETEAAVRAALGWLARHQAPDGSWRVQEYTKQCTAACAPNPGHDDFDAGVTGLAMLAFLGAGATHHSKDAHDGIRFGDVVRRGLQWMMSKQDPEGCVGSRNAQKYMYNHGICTLALVEAFALTKSNLFRDQVQKAVDFTVAAQNPLRGWRYSFKCGDNDTSVTYWNTLALRAAAHAGFPVPQSVFDGAREWLDQVTEESYGRAGYTHKGTGKVFVPGLNEEYDHHETLTAMGISLRVLMGADREAPILTGGSDLILRDKPRWNGNGIDFYYWHTGTQALFLKGGTDNPRWKGWHEDLLAALLKSQRGAADGCKAGSWEPVDRWSGEGGRVYATALNALTLQTYYRYWVAPRN